MHLSYLSNIIFNLQFVTVLNGAAQYNCGHENYEMTHEHRYWSCNTTINLFNSQAVLYVPVALAFLKPFLKINDAETETILQMNDESV